MKSTQDTSHLIFYVGVRKAGNGSGETPEGKRRNSTDGTDEDLSQSDKIVKIFEMMLHMQKDLGQTKLLAQHEAQKAEMAMTSETQMQSTVKQLQKNDTETEQPLVQIKEQLTGNSNEEANQSGEIWGTWEM